MADVILRNRTKRPARMLVLNLTKDVRGVVVTNRLTLETRQGDRRKKIVKKVVPDSIRIPAGKDSANLPEEVLKCPEVADAVKRRDLLVIRQETPAPKAETEPKPAAKTEPKPRRRRG